MSLLHKLPKDLIIEIIKKSKKKYYKLSYGNSIIYVCGNIGIMYEKIRNSLEIQRGIISHWLYYFEKYFSDNLSTRAQDVENLKNKLIDVREKGYVSSPYNYVIEILEKYPIPSAKIEELTFYGDITLYNKMSKNKLIKYLYKIPSMKCYWFYFAIHNEEYYFYLENKMDIVQKINKTIIDNLIKEVKELYKDGHRYLSLIHI